MHRFRASQRAPFWYATKLFFVHLTNHSNENLQYLNLKTCKRKEVNAATTACKSSTNDDKDKIQVQIWPSRISELRLLLDVTKHLPMFQARYESIRSSLLQELFSETYMQVSSIRKTTDCFLIHPLWRHELYRHTRMSNIFQNVTALSCAAHSFFPK